MGDNVYVVTVLTKDPNLTDARVVLSSESDDYSMDLRGLQFAAAPEPPSPLPSPATPFQRSAPIYIRLPKTDEVLAATAEPMTPDARTSACRTQFRYTDAYLSQLISQYQPTKQGHDLRRALAVRFNQGPADTAAVTATPHMAQACAVPYAFARTTQKAEADYPAVAREARVMGTATVRVDLDETGRVVQARVFRSSGNSSLDDEALNAATRSRYAPETFRCQGLAGSYLFVVDFRMR